jgi:hypothetical protein
LVHFYLGGIKELPIWDWTEILIFKDKDEMGENSLEYFSNFRINFQKAPSSFGVLRVGFS